MNSYNKDILMIYKGPFGTLTDSYKWCEYLKEEYNITFVELCGEGEMMLNRVNLIRVSNRGSRFVRGVRFMLYCLLYLLLAKGTIIIFYFDGCDIFKRLFPWKKMILDIRTLSVDKNADARKRSNDKLVKACRRFDHITIIQEDLIKKLQTDPGKFSVVPLGADVISTKIKTYDELNLLYVGTLEGRRISDTIEGLAIFKQKYPEVKLIYHIVGDGITDKKENLIELINKYSLQDVVRVHGRLSYDKLNPFFDDCNIGVSYVPITSWYDHQPPTKTFEYIMSGLFCLATSTSENKKLINRDNGILHKDSPEDFSNALEQCMQRKTTLEFDKIKESLVEYKWKSIVSRKLLPVIISTNKL